MYCSSCGSAVPVGLSYCNRCGFDLRSKEESVIERSKGPSPDSLVWAMVAMTTIGLGTVIALMVVMKEVLNFTPGQIMTFSWVAFGSFGLVDLVFAWLLLRQKRRPREADDVNQLEAPNTRELGSASPHLLSQPALSVTENTTRTLEPVSRERKA